MHAARVRHRRTRIAAVAVTSALVCARATHAQQGTLQVTAAAQAVAADPERRAGQQPLEPDFALTLYQPGFRTGTLFADIHAVRRAGRPHLGQTAFGLRDVKWLGAAWSVTGGDTFVSPSLTAYNFSNLFAPQVSFAGANLSGHGPQGSLTATVGRVTALRNVFGSDPQTLGQDLSQLRASYRATPTLDVLARASRVRTRDVKEFGYYVEAGDDAGIGARARVLPTLELSADGGMSWYRRRGSPTREQSPTGLVGAHWAAPRGWVQVNLHRFAPGYFAVLNTPYLDRAGVFAAAEYEPAARLRLFAGLEAYRTNLDPEASAAATAALPRGLAQRGFAGARLRIAGRSFLTVRAEEGDRSARPVERSGAQFDSDTGVGSADFQTSVSALSTFVRYERRENVDNASGRSTYTQHTATARLFARLGNNAHVFGSAMFMERDQADDPGQTFWQAGGGFQWKLPRRQLWFRGEAVFSRSADRANDLSVPHEVFSSGISGQLTRRTSVSFDVSIDRAQTASPTASPWLARSMLRLTHTVPTGRARIPGTAARASRRSSGTGNLFGVAFADWNLNGQPDAGEEMLSGVPFVFGAAGGDPAPAYVQTGPDGQFAFANVPLGRGRVSLDLATLPADFDAPNQPARETEVQRGRSERLAFGLIPLGSIAGTVVHDVNADGKPDDSDIRIDSAVVLLDGGARSERTRGGAFRFEAVRPGVHEVMLLADSLPEGAAIAGGASRSASIAREELAADLLFLVTMEKRPEIRKVFPPRAEGQKPKAEGQRTKAEGAPAEANRADAKAESVPTVWYAVQVAAMRDRARAWALVRDLQASAVDAYLSEDVDGMAKVRIGSFRSKREAVKALERVRDRIPDAFVAKIGG